ncbi:tRNA 5-methoxyuridine(34)/uridine 5-oxyacetic acid(34) synthase CmoB [Agaribacterium sp. ZY112]|uniref:tRNA 5-methoxyuridine(34)/uridine 5-oxyacetic acid(34) synthase CmoB n=1 Tax=Agaribacterium sp. ZY112 TaxID=3233574 RepID=UPI003523FB8B
MIDFSSFFSRLNTHKLARFQAHFEREIPVHFDEKRFSELATWLDAHANLPKLEAELDCSSSVSVNFKQTPTDEQKTMLDQAFRSLIPWRKGPFQIGDLYIDTEWRSDWKWQRVLPHLSPLKGRKILDVGCGSGYHVWRMLGEGANWVLGIDPTPRFVVQFELLKHFAPDSKADVIPLTLEQMPRPMDFFDTVFSMGVLYHRSSPIDHLKELRACLRPGGELVLETLVVDGPEGYSLMPQERYAQMRNVWFLPSVATLEQWLKRCGFDDIRCVDLNQTSLEEQRTTEWMPSHSLKEFLDANNTDLTVEGLPAPKRAVITAKRRAAKGS